jgi:argininosuccinate lyase
MKAWSGRFAKKTHKKVEEFTNSLPYDCVLYAYDIEQSQAYAEALYEAGVIKANESKAIIKGLKEIKKEIETGKFNFSSSDEDIHMAIEQALIKKTGSAGEALQTGRSRNDQVATSFRMFLLIEIAQSIELLSEFQSVIVNIAEENLNTIMPGYTHLQKAQPVTLAHHLMAYFWMAERDKHRLAGCFNSSDEMPLGSGALSGTPYKINRKKLAKKLGFTNISKNSLDAVSGRDYVAQFLSAIAISLTNLSRLAEEIVLWSTDEFGFVELDDAFATGSSLMPQKKNPDVAELIRAKAPMATANFSAMAGIIKALPLSYNRDFQEDKKLTLDSLDMFEDSLEVLTLLLSTLTFNKEAMAVSVENSFSLATEIADYLVNKGVPFRQSHELTGKIVQKAVKKGIGLQNLSLLDYKKVSELFEEDIYMSLKPKQAVSLRKLEGGTAPSAVKKQIAEAKELLKS